jgi:hypothetical protein
MPIVKQIDARRPRFRYLPWPSEASHENANGAMTAPLAGPAMQCERYEL